LFDEVGHLRARHAWHGIIGKDQVMHQRVKTFEGFAGGIYGIHFKPEVIEKYLR